MTTTNLNCISLNFSTRLEIAALEKSTGKNEKIIILHRIYLLPLYLLLSLLIKIKFINQIFLYEFFAKLKKELEINSLHDSDSILFNESRN